MALLDILSDRRTEGGDTVGMMNVEHTSDRVNVVRCVVCGRDIPNANPTRKYCERCRGKGAFIRREARYAHASPAIMRQKRKAVQDAKSERRNGP